jgi:hypothetical protein
MGLIQFSEETAAAVAVVGKLSPHERLEFACCSVLQVVVLNLMLAYLHVCFLNGTILFQWG